MRRGRKNSCQTDRNVKIYTVLQKDKSSKKVFLAIDVGNTNVNAAVFRNCGAPQGQWETETRIEIPLSNAENLARFLSEGCRSVPDAAVVGSVAKEFSRTAADAVESVFGLSPLVAHCGMETGLEVSYENPRTLGIDRLANAAALFDRTRSACIAVDLGTATTFDCVSSDGRYLGGAITAGLNSFHGGLTRDVSALPKTRLEFPQFFIGSNTEDCIKSGTMFGYARMVDTMVRALSSEMASGDEDPPSVVATGGAAHVLSGGCETFSETDELLTLKGFVVILCKNEKIFSL